MSHSIEISITLKMDGQSYPGFPLSRRLQVDEVVPLGFAQDAGAGYTALTGSLTSLALALLTTDQALSARVNGQSTGSIPLNTGGILLLFDTGIDTATLLSILNSGGTDANLNGLLGGT